MYGTGDARRRVRVRAPGPRRSVDCVRGSAGCLSVRAHTSCAQPLCIRGCCPVTKTYAGSSHARGAPNDGAAPLQLPPEAAGAVRAPQPLGPHTAATCAAAAAAAPLTYCVQA